MGGRLLCLVAASMFAVFCLHAVQHPDPTDPYAAYICLFAAVWFSGFARAIEAEREK